MVEAASPKPEGKHKETHDRKENDQKVTEEVVPEMRRRLAREILPMIRDYEKTYCTACQVKTRLFLSTTSSADNDDDNETHAGSRRHVKTNLGSVHFTSLSSILFRTAFVWNST